MTVFDNSLVRETQIWPVFRYYGSYNAEQEAERTTTFGLYSVNQLNNNTYLQEFSTAELLNLFNDYTNKMSGLTVEQQNLVLSLASKRYIAALDGIIHAEKMDTFSQKISAESLLWDEKFAALAADRAELATLRIKISSETKRVEAEIEKLQAYISIEIAQLALVDIEISEKQLLLASKELSLASKDLELLRKEIELLNVANEVAQIQLKIIEAGIELVEVDLKVARGEVDIVQIYNQVARLGLLEDELSVAVARTEAERAELSVYDAKVILIALQNTEVAKEIAATAAASADALALKTAKSETAGARLLGLVDSITEQTLQRVFSVSEREVFTELEKTITDSTMAAQAVLDSNRMAEDDAGANAAWTAANGAIRAADIMATARVASTLAHLIKRA
jgi:hypothetical protein